MKFEKLISKLISFKTISEHNNINLLKFIENYLKKYGVSSKIINYQNGRANLYSRIGPDVRGGIILSGHTDVVPTEGQNWKSNPFELKKINNKLFGRGTSDMKSFIAIVLSLIPKMVKSDLKKPIDLMFSYDEEIGCVGIQKAIPFLKEIKNKSKYCIVGEPTEMNVINQHKGKKNFLVTFEGLEAHSSLINDGVNAIKYATKFITFLSNLEEELKSKNKIDENFSPPYATINVGKIDGGIALNIIPKHCTVEFELRDLPNSNSEILVKRIKKYLFQNLEKEMKLKNKKCYTKFNTTNNFPPLKVSKNNSLVNLSLRSLNSNKAGTVSFGTEAGVFDKLGIETLVCGPGSIKQAHQPNEFIKLDQIDKCEIFIEKIIKSSC